MELKYDKKVMDWIYKRLLIVLNGIEMKFLKGERSQVYLLIVLNGIEISKSFCPIINQNPFNRTKWN